MASIEPTTGSSRVGFRGISPRANAWLATVVVIAAAITVHALGRTPPVWYPPCPVHYTTGLYCPGCGSGRALHALMQGDVTTAFATNACFVLLVPLLVGWFVSSIWRGVRHDVAPPLLPSGTALVVLITVVVFTVARNLPWWPLSALAPG